MQGILKFDVITQIHTQSGAVELQPDCNGYRVTNTGNTTVTVDNVVLFAGTVGSILGDSFTVGGNEREILDRREIVIQFGAGTTPRVEITQKFYKNLSQ